MIKLNYFQLFEQLSQISSGREFLTAHNILGHLEAEIPDWDSSTVQAIMYTIANLSGHDFDLDNLRNFKINLINFSISENSSEKICAIRVIRILSDKNSKFIEKNFKIVDEILKSLLDFTDTGIVDESINCCNFLINSNYSNLLNRKFSNHLVESFRRRGRFAATRQLFFDLLTSVASIEGLPDDLISTVFGGGSPIRAALLDFHSEGDYACRESKWRFVSALSENFEILKLFNKIEISNFQKFKEAGIGWTPAPDRTREMETEGI